MTGSFIGRLILMVEGCLYTLKSKCSGYLFYDATSEEVSVVNPPFVSSIPKEANYGFLAKVVPTLTTICVDDDDACRQEIRQELAAQVLGDASCGELIIANAPLCGELPATESADASKQVRLDYMKAADQEDAGCPQEMRFMAYYMGKRGTGQNAVDCKVWVSMRTLRMRKSQWGFIPAGNPLEGTSKKIVAVPVPGGSEADPCYELRIQESAVGGAIPNGNANCDVLIWANHGTPEAGWQARSEVLGPIWLAAPQALAFGANINLPRYDELLAKGCKLTAILQFSLVVSGTTGQGGTLVYLANNYNLGAVSMTGGSSDADAGQVLCPLAGNSLTISRSGAMTGTVTHAFALLGYFLR
jgi:hypothetical protein